MSITVDITGCGIVRNVNNPVVVFLIQVSQNSGNSKSNIGQPGGNSQDWTVYRPFESFFALHKQLSLTFPGIAPLPNWDENVVSVDSLKNIRLALDHWLQSLTSIVSIFQGQAMYIFLCSNANCAPPLLELVEGPAAKPGSAHEGTVHDDIELDEMFDMDGHSTGIGHNNSHIHQFGNNSSSFSSQPPSTVFSQSAKAFGKTSNLNVNAPSFTSSAGVFNSNKAAKTFTPSLPVSASMASSTSTSSKVYNPYQNAGIHTTGMANFGSNSGFGYHNNVNSFQNNYHPGYTVSSSPDSHEQDMYIDDDDKDGDGLDINSISNVGEAEFIYDIADNHDVKTLTTSTITAPPTPVANKGFTPTFDTGSNQQLGSTGGMLSAIFSDNKSASTSSLPSSISTSPSIVSKPLSQTANSSPNSTRRKINLDSFQIIRVIGKGSFGKVFLVREKASGNLFALKVLKKEYIIRKKQVEHTRTERSVLGYVHHPFIVGLNMAFQTSDKLFFVLDYCAGGELFFHLGKVGRFPEERAKFYAAQIVLALEYVHGFDIVYRY